MIAHETAGAGAPLILVHGSPGNGGMWKGVIAALGGRYTTYSVTLPDHDRPPDATYPAREVADFAREIESLAASIGRPVHVAGHSFGGVIALRMALRQTAAISRMVLLEPVAIPALAVLGEAAAASSMGAIFDTYRDRHLAGDAPAAAATMVDFWFGPGAFARMPDPMQLYIRNRNALTVRDVTAVLAERYTPEGIAADKIPTLVVCGGTSPAGTHLIAGTLAPALGAGEVAILEGAGHALLTTHPVELAALIDAFLAG